MGTYRSDQGAPARSWVLVAPSDSSSNNLPSGCRGLYIGEAGDVALVGDDDHVEIFTGCLGGSTLPCGPKRINLTGTTSGYILALY